MPISLIYVLPDYPVHFWSVILLWFVHQFLNENYCDKIKIPFFQQYSLFLPPRVHNGWPKHHIIKQHSDILSNLCIIRKFMASIVKKIETNNGSKFRSSKFYPGLRPEILIIGVKQYTMASCKEGGVFTCWCLWQL